MTYVYFITNGRKNVVKIGVAKNPSKRLKTFQTANHEKLIVLRVIRLNSRTEAFRLERALHQKFKKYHIRGEWFKLTSTVLSFIENFQLEEVPILEQFVIFLRGVLFILVGVLIFLIAFK